MEKIKLYVHCEQLLVSRVQQLSESIITARIAANSDTKSSMGDKYETSREMMQQEINQLEAQHAEIKKQLFQLRNINLNSSKVIEVGSLVFTDKGVFFLLVSLGEIKFDEQKVMIISAVSPLGKQLLGKRKNDQIIINHHTYIIIDFY